MFLNKQTNEPGRNFFWLLFFLRQKKSDSPSQGETKAKIPDANQ
jgi:hypothetical protein